MTSINDLDASLAERCQRMGRMCGVVVSLLGFAVLLGWALDNPSLRQVLPGLASMKPNTALCLLLTGVALAALSTPIVTRAAQLASIVLAGCGVLIALITLVEYVWGLDLHIDQLLFHVDPDPISRAPPGRMAKATTVALLCGGVAVMLLNARTWRYVSQTAAVGQGLIGLLACVGYAFGVEALYGLGAYSSVAVHTAVGFILLSLGTLLARPTEGMMRLIVDKTAGGLAARRLLPYVLCVPIILGWLLVQAERNGLFHGTFGMAFLTVISSLLFAVLVWRTANALRVSELERSAIQRDLRTQELKFGAIIRSVMDAVIVLDDEQRIVLFNPAAEEMFARRSGDMVGRTLEPLLPQSAWASHSGFVQAFGASTDVKRPMGRARSVNAVRSNGQHFPVEVSISKVDVDGKRLYTAVLRDVTELREKTEQARLAAEEATRTKSAFLANMSHEIRTPLNAIIGLSNLLQRTGATPEQADRLGKIDVAARHLLSVVNDILDLSKIEAGGLRLAQTDLHLLALFDNVQSIIGEQARGKGLTVQVDLDSVPLWLHGDVTRLGQALLNYASNAVKFTEKGCIILRAVLVDQSATGLLVRFEVQDTGSGIAADTLPRLFNAFEQADTSITRVPGGSGLGLAITKHLAQLMGGEVGVHSVPGEGSTFWFTARLGRGRGPMPVSVVPAAVAFGPEEQLRRRHGGARVLLVEDNAINREVATELLLGVGLDVDCANNGQVAIDMARAHVYDLILMDMQMPVLDGLTATRSIRRLANWATRPIVGLTANAFSEDREMCLQAGMNDFVVKPVEPNALFRALLRWLPKRPPEPDSWDEFQGALDKATDADLELRLRQLNAVDAAYGLHLLNGKVASYARLLREFAKQAQPEIESIRSRLSSSEPAAALALIHSLKGASGSIGATALQALLAELEIAVRQSRSIGVVQQLVSDVAAKCSELVDEILALDES
jgi:PAS domain S-box-containing protein